MHLCIHLAIKIKMMASEQCGKSDFPMGGQQAESVLVMAAPSLGTIAGEAILQSEDVGSSIQNQDEVVLVECIYSCGPPRPITEMVNIGSSLLACWSCSSCNGARKAFEYQAKKDPSFKAILQDLKKKDPGLWRQKVRPCRILVPNDPQGTRGVLCARERTDFINEFKTSLIQRVAVQDVVKRSPMNKSQFIAHLRYKEG